MVSWLVAGSSPAGRPRRLVVPTPVLRLSSPPVAALCLPSNRLVAAATSRLVAAATFRPAAAMAARALIGGIVLVLYLLSLASTF